MSFVVWFRGGPTDRWHQWAMRTDEAEADGLTDFLVSVKDVYDSCYTLAGSHPNDEP